MKKQLFFVSKKTYLWFMMCISLMPTVFFWGCEKENSSVQEELRLTDPNLAVSISFDLETVSYTKIIDKPSSHLEALYRNWAKPIVQRSKLQASIFKNGQSEWNIEELEPTIKIPSGKENIPPDKSPKAKFTKIKNGIAYFYDAGNKLLYSQEMQVPLVASLLKSMGLNQYLPTARVAQKGLDERLKEAKDKGHIVTDLNEQYVSITAKVKRNEFHEFKEPLSEKEALFHSVEIVDKKNDVIIGNSLYDSENQLLSRNYYKYKFSEDKKTPPTLEVSQTEVYRKDSNQNKVVIITNSTYKDLRVEISSSNSK